MKRNEKISRWFKHINEEYLPEMRAENWFEKNVYEGNFVWGQAESEH